MFQNILRALANLFPNVISLFKVNNRNTTTKCEIGSMLIIKTSENTLGVFIIF